MAKKYHIKDDGTPGECRASDSGACPKTQAGDAFHGTIEEAEAESKRRFEETYDAFPTTSKNESKSQKTESEEVRVNRILEDFDKLVAEHGEKSDKLRTAVNKARTLNSRAKHKEKYDAFLEKTGYQEKMDKLQAEAEALGHNSIGALKASKVYATRTRGNSGLELPPGVKSEEAIAYTFSDKPGWLVAAEGAYSEKQYFLYKEKGTNNWVSARIDSDISPLSLSARTEIQPDGLRTFRKENASKLFKPTKPLAGKYSIDGDQERLN